MRKPLLFVSHDASRTGAPIDLLRFLRWLKAHHHRQPTQVLFKRSGPLINNFAELYPVYCWPEKPSGPSACIVGNTLAVLDVVNKLPGTGCPIIIRARELEYVIQTACDPDLLSQDIADFYVADSYAVKEHLENNYHINAKKIECVYEGVPLLDYNEQEKKKQRALMRDEVGIPADAFIVLCCGTISWRKGADTFLEIVHAVHQRMPASPIHFVWVGMNESALVLEQLMYDVRKMKLDQTVHYIGPRVNAREYAAASDIYLMTSREEPLSIAMLEAASVGLPVICFKDAGGSEEFVGEDAGLMVPYQDTEAAASAVIRLYQSPEDRRHRGKIAQERVQQRHNFDDIAPRMMAIIEQSIRIRQR